MICCFKNFQQSCIRNFFSENQSVRILTAVVIEELRTRVNNFFRLAIILAHITTIELFQSGILRSDFFHGPVFFCFCCCLRNIKNKSSLIPNQIVFADWISSFSNLIFKFWDFLRIVDVKKLRVLDGKNI